MRADWDALFDVPVDADVEPVAAGNVSCHWIRPVGTRRDAVIVYLHGGGYRVGSVASHRDLMARLATAAGVQVLGVDYRLAPEHPLPAAIEDSVAVLDWLDRIGFPPERTAVAGDSAGGGLAVSAILSRLKDGKPRPAAAYLMSAWTDLTASGQSYTERAELDPIHQRHLMLAMAQGALGPGSAAEDPRWSPLRASRDLVGRLPPTLLQVGERETLVSDTVDFAMRAQAEGALVQFEIWPGMIHVFQQFAGELPQAEEAIAAGGRFIARHLAPAKAD
ncbi:alpha/beta hydrolase [Rhodopseudomonas palustris]|uniref:Alpha/beta hydrolase n=2 Tax=Rhodopseudomonas palustris TaxID=1076 RepID=A0A323UI44_RHOPL|nr:alpha/beta hydrolase [Rhodopseudomonas palustris]